MLDCSNAIANALALLQSCTKPSVHMFPKKIKLDRFQLCKFWFVGKAQKRATKASAEAEKEGRETVIVDVAE